MKITRTDKKYTPFMIDVPPSITGTRRVRKFFATSEEATGYLSRLKRDGFDRADIRAISASATSVHDLAEMWIQSKTGLATVTMKQLEGLSRALKGTDFGRMDVANVTHREAAAWLAVLPGGVVHKQNQYRLVRRMFQWGVDWAELCQRNPFTKVPKPTGDRLPVQIISPDTFHAMIKKAASRPDSGPLLAYLGLGGLAGMRTCEIIAAKWQDIGETEILVAQPKRTKRGLRPRFVEVLPALAALLESCKRDTERVIPWNYKNFRLHRTALAHACGMTEWPDNCLRHSFRTYHVAHFQSVEKTRLQMGHGTSDMTQYQYGGIDRREVAAAWWDLDAVRKALEK